MTLARRNTQVDASSVPSSNKVVRLPKKWPHVVSEGDAVVKIYRESTVIRGTKSQSYLLSYFANGTRQRRRFAEFADASREARKVAERKSQGTLGSRSSRLPLAEGEKSIC